MLIFIKLRIVNVMVPTEAHVTLAEQVLKNAESVSNYWRTKGILPYKPSSSESDLDRNFKLSVYSHPAAHLEKPKRGCC